MSEMQRKCHGLTITNNDNHNLINSLALDMNYKFIGHGGCTNVGPCNIPILGSVSNQLKLNVG